MKTESDIVVWKLYASEVIKVECVAYVLRKWVVFKVWFKDTLSCLRKVLSTENVSSSYKKTLDSIGLQTLSRCDFIKILGNRIKK